MTAALVFFLIVGLVIYGLERNHIRQYRRSDLAGSVNFIDRDAERVSAEVTAAAGLPAPRGHRRSSGQGHVTVRHA